MQRQRNNSRISAAIESLEVRQLLSATVRFDSFDVTTGLALNGNAESVGTAGSRVLRLAHAQGGDGGSAFSSTRVSASQFSTFFAFRITNPGGATDSYGDAGADGLAFVVQPVSSTIGGDGAGIGYAGIDKSVAVEFDIFGNNGNGWEELNDPSSNHVGITTLGDPDHGVGSPNTANVSPDFDNGQLWYAWVDYNGTTLEVRVRSDSSTRPANPTLTRTLDVPAIMEQSTAYIGFTSATGLAWANHDIVRWEYRSDYDPITTTPEAEVKGNSVVIADGDATPSAADHTSFGAVARGATAVSRTYTVRNLGQAALTTSGLSVPAGYSITEGLSASIAPGGQDTFSVRLSATSAGTFTGNVSFANNDADENPYNFAIKGVVTQPTFSLINKILTVTGTSGNDYIRGSIASNVLTMRMNNLSKTFSSASSITKIVVNALAGDDLIILAGSVNRPTNLNGGAGNDTMSGGSGADVINGGSDTDSAFRGAGDTVSLVEEILA